MGHRAQGDSGTLMIFRGKIPQYPNHGVNKNETIRLKL